MRKKIHQYVRSCPKCQITNLLKPHFINLHQDIAQTPQDHISIDLLGTYNVTSQRHLLYIYCSLQPHRLSYDNPYQVQKDNDNSDPLIFRHYVKVQLLQNTTF